jgi:hypothetical protein
MPIRFRQGRIQAAIERVLPRSGDLRSGVAPGSETLAERVTFAERKTLVERAALEHRCVR